jgi:hypothetical protein
MSHNKTTSPTFPVILGKNDEPPESPEFEIGFLVEKEVRTFLGGSGPTSPLSPLLRKRRLDKIVRIVNQQSAKSILPHGKFCLPRGSSSLRSGKSCLPHGESTLPRGCLCLPRGKTDLPRHLMSSITGRYDIRYSGASCQNNLYGKFIYLVTIESYFKRILPFYSLTTSQFYMSNLGTIADFSYFQIDA